MIIYGDTVYVYTCFPYNVWKSEQNLQWFDKAELNSRLNIVHVQNVKCLDVWETINLLVFHGQQASIFF